MKTVQHLRTILSLYAALIALSLGGAIGAALHTHWVMTGCFVTGAISAALFALPVRRQLNRLGAGAC